MQIHHVGYLVKNIEDSIQDFQKLGYEMSSPRFFDESRKIFIQFMRGKMGGGRGIIDIELIMPAEGCTLFSKRLKNFAPTPYHICYECKNIEEKISTLREAGFILIREPQAAPAFENRRVAFLYSESAGQIELLEI